MAEYLIFFAVVFGVTLLPAFGPPTWSIIALYAFNSDLRLGPMVATAALGAALGRFLLAHATRVLGIRFLSGKTQASLAAVREVLEKRRRNTVLALGLFALSPVPSAQLFEAAGLACLRLVPFTLAFFAGRVVSYSIYGYTAQGIRSTSLGDVLREELSSPFGIGVQVTMLGLLVLLTRIDWRKRLGLEDQDTDPGQN